MTRYYLKDLGEVQELLLVLNFPTELAEQIDLSVRDEYSQLWTGVESASQRERDFDA